MLLDSHCHLDPHTWGDDAGVDAVLDRARAAGVTRFINIGVGHGLGSATAAREVAHRHPDVWFTAGVHPHDAKDWSSELRDGLIALLADPRAVAIGEMGLDFHYDLSDRDVQRRVLREQIGLAIELRKPIVIHDRESDGETLRILKEEGAFLHNRVLYHCFTGTLHQMEEIVALGGFISIPGIVTFKTAGEMTEVARCCPDSLLLIETDAPYLAPIPFRGRKNEPAFMRATAEKVAALRGLDLSALATLTTANAQRFFGL